MGAITVLCFGCITFSRSSLIILVWEAALPLGTTKWFISLQARKIKDHGDEFSKLPPLYYHFPYFALARYNASGGGVRYCGRSEGDARQSRVGVKADERKALALFNTGASGFKDRDLYVLCANALDGTITASPHNNGSKLTAFSPGQRVMQTATEGKVREIIYWWPRPGSIKPLKKHTFHTKVGDQICGVGYWEGSQTTVSAEGSKSSSR